MKESAYPFALKLDTKLSESDLREKLNQWSPWSMRAEFNNGVSTDEFEKRRPFSDNPLQKLDIVARQIPFEKLRGGRVLDIGCNSGYNSIHCASQYGMYAVGIDFWQRHIEVSSFLADIAGVDDRCKFVVASAEEYAEEEAFDVVLHFGTLYHLKNPLLSLQKAYDSLKPGGYLGLETQVYDDPDDENLCYFMHMQNNDKTNFWALSTHVLTKSLELAGFEEIAECLRVTPPILEKNMHRVIITAHKP